MIAADTNVLVRLMTRDDETQAARAKAFLDAHAEEEGAVFVSDIVLIELCWTLTRGYGLDRQAIATVIDAMINNSTLKLESPSAVRLALDQFKRGTVDYPDCLIVVKASLAGCGHTLTFDKRMASLDGVKLL